MKFNLQLASFFALASFSVCGQGTFVYDQQSSTDETSAPPGVVQVPGFPGYGDGQSFTPSLTSVGFIRLLFSGIGSGTIYVNVRSDSIFGPIIGTSGLLDVKFSGPRTFVFNTQFR